MFILEKKLFNMNKYWNIFVPGYMVECGILVWVGPEKSVQKQRRHDVGAFHMRTWLGAHYAKRNETNLEISLILNAYAVRRKGNDSMFLFLVLKIIRRTNIYAKAAKYHPKNCFHWLLLGTIFLLNLKFRLRTYSLCRACSDYRTPFFSLLTRAFLTIQFYATDFFTVKP